MSSASSSSSASSVLVKCIFNTDVRRTKISSATSYAQLMQLLHVMYNNNAATTTFTVKYRDDDGDMVTISCDGDLREAIRLGSSSSSSTLKLQIEEVMVAAAVSVAASESAPAVNKAKIAPSTTSASSPVVDNNDDEASSSDSSSSDDESSLAVFECAVCKTSLTGARCYFKCLDCVSDTTTTATTVHVCKRCFRARSDIHSQQHSLVKLRSSAFAQKKTLRRHHADAHVCDARHSRHACHGRRLRRGGDGCRPAAETETVAASVASAAVSASADVAPDVDTPTSFEQVMRKQREQRIAACHERRAARAASAAAATEAEVEAEGAATSVAASAPVEGGESDASSKKKKTKMTCSSKKEKKEKKVQHLRSMSSAADVEGSERGETTFTSTSDSDSSSADESCNTTASSAEMVVDRRLARLFVAEMRLSEKQAVLVAKLTHKRQQIVALQLQRAQRLQAKAEKKKEKEEKKAAKQAEKEEKKQKRAAKKVAVANASPTL